MMTTLYYSWKRILFISIGMTLTLAAALGLAGCTNESSETPQHTALSTSSTGSKTKARGETKSNTKAESKFDDNEKSQTDMHSTAVSPKVQKLIKEMTLEEKVYQMFFVRPEDLTGVEIVIQAGEITKQALEKYPVGGIIYFAQNIKNEEQVKEMLQNTQSYSPNIPLFLSVDEEGGRIARLGKAGVISTHPPMAEIGAGRDPQTAARVGESLGKGLNSLGFNVDFAPVADVITVENNEDIGDRSFGEDPELVASMVAAEVEAMQKQGISATLKHFPSNGSTAANTHNGYGECTRTLEEMRAAEFIPFQAGIDAGADMVMVAHMAAVNVTGDSIPSTLSKKVVTDLLRDELGFHKAAISDALNMGAITSAYTPEQAAVKAVEAGIDLLLMSPDFKAAAQAIIQKVKSGEISEARINESMVRILSLKEERGLLESTE